jgi:hypothetical protein
LATFTAALRGAVAGGRGSDDGLGVVSLVDDRLGEFIPEVILEHLNGNGAPLLNTIEEGGPSRCMGATSTVSKGRFGNERGLRVVGA